MNVYSSTVGRAPQVVSPDGAMELAKSNEVMEACARIGSQLVPSDRYHKTARAYVERRIGVGLNDTRTLLLCGDLAEHFWNLAIAHSFWLRASFQRRMIDRCREALAFFSP